LKSSLLLRITTSTIRDDLLIHIINFGPPWWGDRVPYSDIYIMYGFGLGLVLRKLQKALTQT